MQICRTVQDIRAAVAGYRAQGESIGLVTTMGALHAGHMQLVAEARGVHSRLVATIFVNPTQFGNPEDLSKYPRNDARDLEMLEAAGVDVVLIPEVSEIYPDGDETIVETTHLANTLHGEVRPGHFRGVATVVTKLFNIIGPDAAYFGEKDYQQLAVIRRMVKDLHMPLRIHGVATVREADGLAMSSRNVRLSDEDRAAAPVLFRALKEAETLLFRGAAVEGIAGHIRDTVTDEPRATLTGLDIVDAASFQPITGAITGPIGIMISAKFGDIMLIDQIELTPPKG